MSDQIWEISWAINLTMLHIIICRTRTIMGSLDYSNNISSCRVLSTSWLLVWCGSVQNICHIDDKWAAHIILSHFRSYCHAPASTIDILIQRHGWPLKYSQIIISVYTVQEWKQCCLLILQVKIYEESNIDMTHFMNTPCDFWSIMIKARNNLQHLLILCKIFDGSSK